MARTTATSGRKLTDLLDGKFLARLDNLDVFSRKIFQGKLQGERRTRRRGQSVEFADHRPYVVGDDLRHIDWNIYGRLDQLFLKIFLEEQDLSVQIMVDVSTSCGTGQPAKDRYMKQLAAALAYVGLVNHARVTVSTFNDGIVGQLANMRGRGYVHRMAELLLSARANGPSNFDKACRDLVNARLGTGIMIVISDFWFKEGFETGLRRLVSRNYDLYAVQVLSPQEVDPPLTGDLKLVDLEDGDTAEVTVSGALVKYYKRTLNAYCNELREFCMRRGASYVLANSKDSAETMVLNYLRRRGLVR